MNLQTRQVNYLVDGVSIGTIAMIGDVDGTIGAVYLFEGDKAPWSGIADLVCYRSAFASSLIPPPPSHRRPLQSASPRGEATGLLRSSPRSIRGEVVPLG